MKRIAMTGERYSKLVVLEELGRKLKVLCDCGISKEVLRSNVLAGYTTSCGCVQKIKTSKANLKHGHSAKHTPTYISWKAMWNRCRNPMYRSSHRYSERGISADPAWQDFRVFLKDMGERPVGTELDRIDNNLGYCKENCRWATHQENCQNKG